MALGKPKKRAFFVWTPKGGTQQTLYFDLIVTEKQSRTSLVTDSPVEVGPDVTDNVRPALPVVTLECFSTDYAIVDVNKRGFSTQSVPLDIKTFTPGFTPSIGGLFNLAFPPRTEKLPTARSAFVWSSAFDNVAETHLALDRLQETAQLIDVYTTTRVYRNSIIQSVDLLRNAGSGSGGGFSVTIRQLQLIEFKLVSAPVPTVIHAKVAVKKGPQGAAPATQQQSSVLKREIADRLNGVRP